MTQDIALRLTAGLIGFSIALSCLEFIFLITNKSIFKVWSFKNLENELIANIPLPKKLIQTIFADENLIIFVAAQMICAVSLISNLNFPLVLASLLIQIVICIRFRGTFNGGSDFMTVVVLTGLLISTFNPDWSKWGLIYVAIHGLYSYFKAGFVKVKNPQWMNGVALIEFIQRSPITFTKNRAEFLKGHHFIIKIFSILVIVFELSIPILIKFPNLVVAYFCIALLFHFLVFISFGLNRFFWVWMATWPAIIFTVTH